MLAPSRSDILAAYERAALPTQAQLDALVRKGASPWSIAGEPDSGERAVRFARVVFNGARFDFDPTVDFDMPAEGVPAAVVLALNDFEEPADLVAWPLKGDGLASWLGAVAMLGQQHVMGARLDPALTIFRSGLDWLRGERDGVVLIDPKRAGRELADYGPFAVATVEHGNRLEALLTQPPPGIYVVSPADIREAA